jgi:hypothetical protein
MAQAGPSVIGVFDCLSCDGDATGRRVFAGVSRVLKRKSMTDDTSIAGESAAADSASQDEEIIALRWRRAILKLSETLMDAAGERSDLSPILMEAMHNALEKLLVYGEEDDLMTLEEWLSEESPDSEEHSSLPENPR